MASPQKENGFTPIANEVMEALAKHRISGELRQVIDFIIRKTWGYGKKDDQISNLQFCQGTGMNKSNVHRSLKRCQKRQLVVKNDNTSPPTYCFNKDYSKWIPVVRSDNVVNIATKVVRSDNKKLSEVTDTKDNKDNIQKKIYCEVETSQSNIFIEDEIFLHWKNVMGKNKAVFTPQRKKLISKALKAGYSAEILKQAIDGCKKSLWHQGENPEEKKYNSLELILRNDEKIDNFLTILEKKGKEF